MHEACGRGLPELWMQQRSAVKESEVIVTPADRAIRSAGIRSEERDEAIAEEIANRNQNFVQFPRPSIEAFIGLISKSPTAAQILLVMAMRMGWSNVVGLPSKGVCAALGISRATFSRALGLLKEDLWIEPAREFGVSAYRVNALAFWTTGRRFKAAAGVFRASLTVTRNPDGIPMGEVLKAVVVPVIVEKASKRPRRKGQTE